MKINPSGFEIGHETVKEFGSIASSNPLISGTIAVAVLIVAVGGATAKIIHEIKKKKKNDKFLPRTKRYGVIFML